jgi:serine phosphatase RsbU (regulator of sigma subunit)/tetratricopeptide (TPR) repeat protein
MKKILPLIIFFLLSESMHAQDAVTDSLQRIIKNAKHDTVRLSALNMLVEITDDDKVWPVYNLQEKTIAEHDLQMKPGGQLEKRYKFYLANTYHNIAYLKSGKGEVDSALAYYDSALVIRKDIKDSIEIGNTLYGIGQAYNKQGNQMAALDYFLSGLTMMQDTKDTAGIGRCLNVIGTIYKEQRDLPNALSYYKQSLALNEKSKNDAGTASALNNIAMIYLMENDTSSLALAYYLRSLELRKKVGVKSSIAQSLENTATCYQRMKKFPEALKYSKAALEMRQSINDNEGISSSLNSLGCIYRDQHKLDSALLYALPGMEKANELGYPIGKRRAAQLLYDIYKAQGKWKDALEMHELMKEMNDKIVNEETRKSGARMEMKYKYEQKAAADSLKVVADRQIVAAQLDKEQTKNYALFGGLVLVLVFAGFMFNRFRVTRNQKRVIEEQKHLVVEKQKEILDSITYARRLQEAILPPMDFVKSHLPESFVFYKPKDIVAGDFYWMEAIGPDLVCIAAADCTGHGVPGAMVSVVCSTALNRSVIEFGIKDTGKILNKTRELVLETFARSNEEVKDGMDISLACINSKTSEVQWSGAFNPLWYISNEQMKEITANKQPIGKNDQPLPFTTHTLQFRKGDMLFLFTDGYADQFGGPKGKKFKYKPLKEMLLANHKESPEKQMSMLESALTEWKGTIEQVDDITIIGIRM